MYQEVEIEHIREFEVFRNLTQEESEEIFSNSEQVSIDKDETLFREGDSEAAFYVVLNGEILVYKENKNIAVRRTGEYFGEMAMIDSCPRAANAKALSRSTLLKITQESFDFLIAANAQFCLKLLKTLVQRTREDLGALNLGYKKFKSQKRVASYLNRILDDSTNEIYSFEPGTLKIVRVNKPAQENLGYDALEIKELTPVDLIHGMTREKLDSFLTPLLAEEKPLITYEGKQLRKDGSFYPVEIRFQLIETDASALIVAIVADISERVEMEKKIRQLAYFDSLTALPNRNLLLDKLKNQIKKASAKQEPFSLVHIDLDGFKNINDSLGQEGGDLLLREVSKRIRNVYKDAGTLARLRGDEFILLLPTAGTRDEAAEVAEKVRGLIDDMFHIQSYDIHLTTSIGISLYPQDGDTSVTLLKNADTALGHSKLLGKNQFSFYDPALEPLALEKMTLVGGLKKALKNEEFFLVYQPKINVNTGGIVGAEVLIRWEHPERGLVSPGVFIPLAEESGLIVGIGEWVLREGGRQLKRWHQMGHDQMKLSVNFSGRQFREKGVLDTVRGILVEENMADHGLELEFTESVLIENAGEGLDKLQALHDMGVLLSIDDFGTGYSSMKYLKDMPVDCLKIDQCFVRGMEEPANQAIIVSIVTLAEKLGLATVVEGVENQQEVDFLKSVGCDIMQGYFFAKPLPVEEFNQMLEKQSGL